MYETHPSNGLRVQELEAEVARLNRALDFAELDVNQARADLDRALDALAALLAWNDSPHLSGLQDWHPYSKARAVLAAHDREAHDE